MLIKFHMPNCRDCGHRLSNDDDCSDTERKYLFCPECGDQYMWEPMLNTLTKTREEYRKMQDRSDNR